MIDLLIAGGGPAGLATAIHGALAGLEVVVVEPRPTPIDKACGEGLMPGGVRHLRGLGVTVTGQPFQGIRYVDGVSGRRAEGLFRSGPGLGARRTELQAALAERAAQLGVRVLPGRIDQVRQDVHQVGAAGLTARYLVAADGLHSPSGAGSGCRRRPPRADRHVTGCAATTPPRRGATSSRCIGRRGARRTSPRWRPTGSAWPS